MHAADRRITAVGRARVLVVAVHRQVLALSARALDHSGAGALVGAAVPRGVHALPGRRVARVARPGVIVVAVGRDRIQAHAGRGVAHAHETQVDESAVGVDVASLALGVCHEVAAGVRRRQRVGIAAVDRAGISVVAVEGDVGAGAVSRQTLVGRARVAILTGHVVTEPVVRVVGVRRRGVRTVSDRTISDRAIGGATIHWPRPDVLRRVRAAGPGVRAPLVVRSHGAIGLRAGPREARDVRASSSDVAPRVRQRRRRPDVAVRGVRVGVGLATGAGHEEQGEHGCCRLSGLHAPPSRSASIAVSRL